MSQDVLVVVSDDWTKFIMMMMWAYLWMKLCSVESQEPKCTQGIKAAAEKKYPYSPLLHYTDHVIFKMYWTIFFFKAKTCWFHLIYVSLSSIITFQETPKKGLFVHPLTISRASISYRGGHCFVLGGFSNWNLAVKQVLGPHWKTKHMWGKYCSYSLV